MSSDMVTHLAEYISDITKYNISENIIAHSKTFGYPLYMLKDFDTKDNYSIGMLRTDWNTYISIKSFNDIKTAFLYENDKLILGDSYDFCCLTDTIIEKIKEYENNNFSTFIFQKFLSPDKKFNVTKKFEFEIGYYLISELNNLVVFKHQENIMNYHADFLLELKNNLNRDIPTIVVVEIQEDNHKNYDKENEKFRKKVVEAFGNRIVSIPVNRNSSDKEIKNIANKFAKQIKELCKDLIVEYSPEIKDDDFIHLIEEHNIEKNFIQLFFKKSENTNTIYKYSHQEVGEFLGFSNLENYREFRNLITKNFIDGKDYIISDEIFKTTKHGGRNKKIYLLSRKTFISICFISTKPRAKQAAENIVSVNDIMIDYIQKLRAKNIKNKVDNRPNMKNIKKRVDDLVEQRVSKYKVSKVEKENNELKEKIKELKEMIKKNEEVILEKDRYWKSSISRTDLLLKENNDMKYKIEELEKENQNLLKELRKDVKKDIKEDMKKDVEKEDVVKVDVDMVEKCRKYLRKTLITHLKLLCKDVGGVSGYTSYKKEDKEKLENLIIKYMEKNQDFSKKVIQYLNNKKQI
jgi:hypothetical protein